MLNRVVTTFGVLLMTGCAAPQRPQALPSDHPASPAAAEAELPARSNTLGPAPAELNGPTASPRQGPEEASAGGSAAAPPDVGAARQLYACPMHPEITSANPNDRCPKCKMKINKPVNKAGAPATAPASPAGGHENHAASQGGR